MRFDVFMVENFYAYLLWVVTPCELVSMYQCFRGKILLMKQFSCVIFL
jgi:hypothetical protein